MEDTNSSIFVQAKIEYTKQLINNLQSHLFDGVKSIYDDSKEIYKENSSSSQLFIFRTLLEKVPEWNNELIIVETDRIIEMSKCDYLEDLLTAVFVSHTKILMSISVNNGKINLTVPKLSNFIHKCYINIARSLWKNPLLFSENITGLEYQKNLKIIEDIIYDCIENTVRFSLPVKDILKGQLELYDNKSEEKDKEITDNDDLLNKLKELLNLKGDKGDKEDNVEGLKPSIEITKESDINIDKEEDISLRNGYESPGEETIDNNCNNLVINDIDEIIVDKNVYDNPEIIEGSLKDNGELFEKLVKIKQGNDDTVVNEVIVSKVDEPLPGNELVIIPDAPILSADEKLKKEQESRNYDKIVDITDKEEKNKKKTNIEDVIIDDNVIKGTDKSTKDDDKDTVDFFMDDLQNMKKPEISLDKVEESKYVLFDDL
mgnify:CR=1 FL=1